MANKKDTTRTKFNVTKDKSKLTYKGVVYDSMMEMNYFKQVIEPGIQDGTIRRYERQVPYILQPAFTYEGKKILAIKYIADYVVYYTIGEFKVIDIKGMADNVALLKCKMFKYTYPDINYIWLCYSAIDGGWVEYDVVKKSRSARAKAKKVKQEKFEESDGNYDD